MPWSGQNGVQRISSKWEFNFIHLKMFYHNFRSTQSWALLNWTQYAIQIKTNCQWAFKKVVYVVESNRLNIVKGVDLKVPLLYTLPDEEFGFGYLWWLDQELLLPCEFITTGDHFIKFLVCDFHW